MTITDDLQSVAETLKTWASTKPFIRKIWIFGSRAQGTPSPDSDLDVALDIDPMGNDEDSFTSFVSEAHLWRAELQAQLPYELHLEWYDSTNAPVTEGVKKSGILIYERTRGTCA